MKKRKLLLKKRLSKKKTIISIGRLTKQKNFQFLIKVFSIINKLYSEFKFCIIGDGEDRTKIERHIKKYRINR